MSVNEETRARLKEEYPDCPECGESPIDAMPDGSVVCTPHVAGAYLCLRVQLAQRDAIIGKLPKYTDTGETFVPGVDPCWATVWPEGKDVIRNLDEADWFAHGPDAIGWIAVWGGPHNDCTDEFYSTREAAENAKL